VEYLRNPLISALALVVALTLSASPHRKEPGGGLRKVLVVHSYHYEYEWVSTISRGIKREFEKAQNVRVETLFMDTKRNTSEQWKEEAGRKARSLISEWDPDVVITIDDNAQMYVGSYFVGRSRPSIIFCGVNGAASQYGYPASNATGILERPHMRQSVKLLERITGGIDRIAIISDNSPTSRGAVQYMRNNAGSMEQDVISYDMPTTFSRWKELILKYQEEADAIMIYMYHTVRREGGERSLPPRVVMDWTSSNTRIPIIGFFTFSVDDGALLGVVESGLEHGREAAKIARRILCGHRVNNYPVITATEGIAMFNLNAAGSLGLSLPPEVREEIDIIVGE
jgi:ABC-type uncharacterized transport system substrate-binding protein